MGHDVIVLVDGVGFDTKGYRHVEYAMILLVDCRGPAKEVDSKLVSWYSVLILGQLSGDFMIAAPPFDFNVGVICSDISDAYSRNVQMRSLKSIL